MFIGSPYRQRACCTGFKGVLEWFEPACLIVEVAQIIVHEGDEPDPFAHLFDADVLTARVVAAMLSKLVSLVKNFDQREAAIMLGVALLTDGICPQQFQN